MLFTANKIIQRTCYGTHPKSKPKSPTQTTLDTSVGNNHSVQKTICVIRSSTVIADEETSMLEDQKHEKERKDNICNGKQQFSSNTFQQKKKSM